MYAFVNNTVDEGKVPEGRNLSVWKDDDTAALAFDQGFAKKQFRPSSAAADHDKQDEGFFATLKKQKQQINKDRKMAEALQKQENASSPKKAATATKPSPEEAIAKYKRWHEYQMACLKGGEITYEKWLADDQQKLSELGLDASSRARNVQPSAPVGKAKNVPIPESSFRRSVAAEPKPSRVDYPKMANMSNPRKFPHQTLSRLERIRSAARSHNETIRRQVLLNAGPQPTGPSAGPPLAGPSAQASSDVAMIKKIYDIFDSFKQRIAVLENTVASQQRIIGDLQVASRTQQNLIGDIAGEVARINGEVEYNAY